MITTPDSQSWEEEFDTKFRHIEVMMIAENGHSVYYTGKKDIKAFISKVESDALRRGREQMIKELLEHNFHTYTAKVALMDGNVQMSTVSEEVVFSLKELKDYLSSINLK